MASWQHQPWALVLCVREAWGGGDPSETAPPPAQLAENYSLNWHTKPATSRSTPPPAKRSPTRHRTLGCTRVGTTCKTATFMYTEHTPRTRAPGGLRVYARRDARTQRGACVNTNAYVRGHTRRGLPTGHADLYTHTNGTAPPAGSRALPSQPRGSRGRRTARAQLGAGLGRPPSGRPPDCPSGPRCRPALAAA